MVISPSLVDDTPCDEPGHELVNGQCLDLRADAGIPVDDGEDGLPPPDCAIPGGCLGDNPPGDGESGDEGDGNAEGEGDDDGDSNGSNNGDSGTEDGGGNGGGGGDEPSLFG